MERWKVIEGTKDLYEVSETGKVRRVSTGQVLKPTINENGYCYVTLSIGEGRTIKRRVHRLVAEAFVKNPLGLAQINHKDENKQNNTADNLEWCTAGYNINYGTRNQRHAVKMSRPVLQMNIEGAILKRWPSMTEAQRILGISKRNISRCCRGLQNTAYGYRWKYE